jgi:hypothetical protein
MLQTKAVDKLKKHFMFSNLFFENGAVYEMRKNVVGPASHG